MDGAPPSAGWKAAAWWTGLPSHNFYTEQGDVALKCPTEMPITDRREKELADLGFVPLVHCKGTDYAAFFSVQTCQKPKIYDTERPTPTPGCRRRLPYMMAVSRFAHYLKSMMRDKIGSFMSRKEAEIFLNHWIIKYVIPDDTASPADKGAVSFAGSPRRCDGNSGEAGMLPSRGFLAAAFPDWRS